MRNYDAQVYDPALNLDPLSLAALKNQAALGNMAGTCS